MKTVLELIISKYFLMKTILGVYLSNEKALFSSLCKIFLLPEAEIENLYQLAEDDLSKSICTESDFFTYLRTNKYFSLTDNCQKEDSIEDEIVKIKGNAILLAQKKKIYSHADATKNTVYNNISLAVTEGNIEALQTMGILHCEGIIFPKNKKIALSYLAKATAWNDIFSVLATLYYFKENRKTNLQRLKQIVVGTPFAELYIYAVQAYGESSDEEICEVELLERAFELGILTRDVYEPFYARILESNALTVKDKEKALFSKNKEYIAMLNDLPLNLSEKNIVPFTTDKLKETALKRKAERETIERILKNSDLRVFPSFRPLCLCCDSDYVLNMYAKAISEKSTETHVQIVDVSVLTEYDLNPTLNNVFVSGIDENKDNRLLLFFSGEISKAKMEIVKTILITRYRKNFHLASPNATLDLGAVLPICFTNERNLHLLKAYCDVVKLTPLSNEEKVIALKDILNEKEKSYEIKKIRIDEETSELIAKYDLDIVKEVIDTVIRSERKKGKIITLTEELLIPLLNESFAPRIGFGGRQ